MRSFVSISLFTIIRSFDDKSVSPSNTSLVVALLALVDRGGRISPVACRSSHRKLPRRLSSVFISISKSKSSSPSLCISMANRSGEEYGKYILIFKPCSTVAFCINCATKRLRFITVWFEATERDRNSNSNLSGSISFISVRLHAMGLFVDIIFVFDFDVITSMPGTSQIIELSSFHITDIPAVCTSPLPTVSAFHHASAINCPSDVFTSTYIVWFWPNKSDTSTVIFLSPLILSSADRRNSKPSSSSISATLISRLPGVESDRPLYL